MNRVADFKQVQKKSLLAALVKIVPVCKYPKESVQHASLLNLISLLGKELLRRRLSTHSATQNSAFLCPARIISLKHPTLPFPLHTHQSQAPTAPTQATPLTVA